MEGYIKVVDYCARGVVDNAFLMALRNEGVLRLIEIEEEYYIEEDLLTDVDMFCRWHYDLGVNIAGIDAMRHMLQKLLEMQNDINDLYSELRVFKRRHEGLI